MYDDIFEAYKDAKVDYERPSPILLGKKKERVFTQIIKELLQKMNFKIIRVSIESMDDFNRNSDMTVEDKYGKKYLIEIKAYRKDYCITKREFNQLINYLEKENLPNGIFITTSNTNRRINDKIYYINGNTLIKLLQVHGLNQHIKDVEWIQNSRVDGKEREKYREIMKGKILDYIKIKGSLPTKREIQQEFKIDLGTIFGRTKPYEKFKKEIENLGTFFPRV